MLTLLDFPNEILECIFDFCDEVSLQNVYKTCRHLRKVVSFHKYWMNLSKQSFATNQMTDYVINKSLLTLTPFEKCRVSNNWLIANYTQKNFLKMPQSYMPWLQLDQDHLWIGYGRTIKSYKRSIVEKFVQNEKWLRKPRHDHVLGDASAKGDISRFRKTKNLIVYNQDEKLCCYDTTTEKYLFKKDISTITPGSTNAGTCSTNGWKTNDALDFNEDIDIITFHTNESVYVSRLQDFAISKHARVWNRNCWRLKLCDEAFGSNLLIGATKDGYSYLFDMERGVELSKFGGPGRSNTVLDICWQSPTLFLTGGYDSIIRLWDSRCLSTTNNPQTELEDPFNSAIYCLASDKDNSILAGMQMNARVNACDLRNQKFLQMYYMSTRLASPIYSLEFEPRQMFAATACAVHLLDFTTYNNPVTVLNIRGVSVGFKNDHRIWLN